MKILDTPGFQLDLEYIKDIVREMIGSHITIYHNALMPTDAKIKESKQQVDEAFQVLRSIVREEIIKIMNDDKVPRLTNEL